MNKKDFNNELNELLSSMSEEEIEQVISALNSCKPTAYKVDSKNKNDKAEYLPFMRKNEAELYYIGEKNSKGIIKAIGASVLTSNDFWKYKFQIPKSKDNWWLYNKFFVVNENAFYCREENNASYKIRPILVIDSIEGNLEPGEYFYINNEKFYLITPSLAIRVFCLKDPCIYKGSTDDYRYSGLKYCIDGWYMNLVDESKTRNDAT